MLLYVYFIDPSEVKPIEDIFYPHTFKDPSQISFNITYKYKISPVLMTMMKKENNFFFFTDINKCVHWNCTDSVNKYNRGCQVGFTGVKCDTGMKSMHFINQTSNLLAALGYLMGKYSFCR